MKKRFFRILSCCVLLACLCALPAYAQEPKAAQPAAKEDKVVTDITGSADLMRNVVGFTTNFGGPYHFAQADHKSPAQAYGDAPAEGAVAVLRLFARADDHGDVPLNTSGHSFLTITNVSEQDINVGGLLIAPDTSITVSTRGNRCEHSGIWYNPGGLLQILPERFLLSESLRHSGLTGPEPARHCKSGIGQRRPLVGHLQLHLVLCGPLECRVLRYALRRCARDPGRPESGHAEEVPRQDGVRADRPV